MDNDNVAGWVNSLLRPKEPIFRLIQPLLVWALLGAGAFFGLAGVLLLGWNLLCPLFSGPGATYPEAMGAAIFVCLMVLGVFLLKEGKE